MGWVNSKSDPGWGTDKPTGYWLVWQEGLKGPPDRIKASSEQEARQKYQEMYGYKPDFCEEEKG